MVGIAPNKLLNKTLIGQLVRLGHPHNNNIGDDVEQSDWAALLSAEVQLMSPDPSSLVKGLACQTIKHTVVNCASGLAPLPEMRGHPIVGIAKMFHNSFNWMCTFSMGINQNNKLPNFRSSRLL